MREQQGQQPSQAVTWHGHHGEPLSQAYKGQNVGGVEGPGQTGDWKKSVSATGTDSSLERANSSLGWLSVLLIPLRLPHPVAHISLLSILSGVFVFRSL